MSLPAAVFLDRDGTVIADVHYIKSPDHVKILPGAAGAVRRLNEAQIPVIIVTNQSGIGRGLLTVGDYEEVRARFEGLLAEEGAHIDRSYYCPDHPSVTGPDGCRKPGSRMFEQAILDFGLDPQRLAYIGDRWRDLAASKKLGGHAILVRSPMTRPEDLAAAQANSVEVVPSLADAVDMLFGLTSDSQRH